MHNVRDLKEHIEQLEGMLSDVKAKQAALERAEMALQTGQLAGPRSMSATDESRFKIRLMSILF